MAEASSTRDWDAKTYDRVNAPHREWALPIIDRLELSGTETVLDAGCGSGSVTALLAERLSGGRVIGVDGSAAMIEKARENLPPGTELIVSDLLELRLSEPVDAVFSSATFHWIGDHERLFEVLLRALRPGGRLVAQCGGKGNIAEFRDICREVAAEEPFAPHFEGWDDPWNYAAPAETEERLRAAGFSDVSAWLEDRPTRLPESEVRDFITTICLGHHHERLPEDLRDSFTEEIIGRMSDPALLSYVRLNMRGKRP
jgi:trans-aconitate 2-methyltransferase